MIGLDLFTEKLKNSKETLLSFGDSIDLKNASKETMDKFTSLLKIIRNLNSLTFHHVNLASFDFNTSLLPIFQAINENAEIRGLSLRCCFLEQLNANALSAICHLENKNIRNLNLSHNKLGNSNETVNFLIKFLQLNLQKLACNHVGLAECGFAKVKKIIQSIAASKSLTTLELHGFNFEENIKICELLLILFSSNINNISLNYSCLGENMSIADWIKVLDVIKNKNKLRYLNLSDCGLGLLDMDARIQAETGTGNPEAFVEVFGPFLQSTPIEVIDISGNSFLKETTVALLKYSMQNTKLNLICERNGLTKKEIEDLKIRFEQNQKAKMAIPRILPTQVSTPVLMAFPASTATIPETNQTLQDTKEPEKPIKNLK